MEWVVPIVAVAALLGFGGFVLYRLWRSLRLGLSIRMQVFVALAVVAGGFAALLGLLAVQGLESRAARIDAEVAQENAELLARVLAATDQPPGEVAHRLVGFSGLRIEILDEAGRPVHVAGPVPTIAVQRSAPIRGAAGRLGSVRVSRPSLGLSQIMRGVAARAAVLSLLLVLATALAAALVGRAIAKPIERLTLAASRIAHGERQAVLPRPFGREVRTLTAAVESMRRELEGRHLAERLAADLSHELRNPVAAIRASAEVLADGALDEPLTARRFVERILEAAERLHGIVNNLLALTRLQARGIAQDSVDVAELCRQSIDAHAPRAAQQRLQLVCESPADGATPVLVRGDAVWLRRAIDNLIDNALGFAVPPAPGDAPAPSVIVRVLPDPSLPDEDGEALIAIDVINRGPGVAPEVRERLFERFVTTRRDTGGSGLGLAIVAAVAEQHRGSVQLVDPGPPETRFRLCLPRDRAVHEIFP